MNHKKTSRKALKKASVALAMTVGILSGMLVTAEAKTGAKQSGSSIYSEGEVSDFAGSSYILGAKKGASSVNVEEVKLNKAKADITVGKTVKLTAKVLPEDATDKTVRWSVIKGGSKVKLYSDSDCKKELGSKATDILTVYAKGITVTGNSSINGRLSVVGALTASSITSSGAASVGSITSNNKLTVSAGGVDITGTLHIYRRAAELGSSRGVNHNIGRVDRIGKIGFYISC